MKISWLTIMLVFIKGINDIWHFQISYASKSRIFVVLLLHKPHSLWHKKASKLFLPPGKSFYLGFNSVYFKWSISWSNLPSSVKNSRALNAFFISNTFISNTTVKLVKNQANAKQHLVAKQHPETEILLFENYSHSSSTLSFKNNRPLS